MCYAQEKEGFEVDDNRQFWDRCARFYTAIQQGTNRKLYEEISCMCMSYISSDMEVLELACGSGQFTYPLCPRAKSWEATDFSEAMIERAQRRPCPAHFSCQDATALPYQNKSFDLILIGNALHIMPQPEKALSEIHRVLKDKGILLAPTFVYEGKVNKLRMYLTNLAGFKTFHQWKEADFCHFVEQAGFRCISSELVSGDPLPVAFSVFRKI